MVGVGAQRNQMGNFFFQCTNRHPEFTPPKIQAIPIKLPRVLLEARQQLIQRGLQANAVLFGVSLRQMLQPKNIIETQIQ